MLSRLQPHKLDSNSVFWILGSFILVAVFAATATETYFLFALPILIVGGWITLVDYKKIFFLLFISIPISIDVALPGGFAVNVFTEPLQILLSGITFLLILKDGRSIAKGYLTHPISLALMLHFAWILITTLFSSDYMVSVKFLIAKAWFILPGFYLTMKLVNSVKDIKQIVWCL